MTVQRKKIAKIFIAGIISIAMLFWGNSKWQIFAWNCIATEPDSSTFRIMTYNVNIGRHNKNIEHEHRRDSLYKVITDINPDVICLQECSRWHIKGLEQQLIKKYPYVAHSYSLYSKYEVVNSFIIEQDTISYQIFKTIDPILYDGCKNTGTLYCADIKISERIIRIINVRLASNNISTIQESSSLKKTWTGINNYRYGSRLRQQQLKTIINLVKESPYPVILCGDMNDFYGSPTLNSLCDENLLYDAWWQSGNGYGTTFRDGGLYIRIDHILYTPCLFSKNTFVHETNFSDHLPLVSDFIY